jgi:hypothetical protein
MAVNTEPRPEERVWLLRALLVLQSPRPVFVALRDDSEGASRARGETLLALIWLAGIAAVLASPQMNTLMDDPARDGVVAAIVIFLGGGMYGALAYVLLGGVLHLSVKALGSRGTYRRSRHLLGFALAPLALSLVTFWVVRIAVEGRALFTYGGSDGGHVFANLFYAFVVWTVALVAVGVRAVHGWTWPRSFLATGIATAASVLLVLGTSVL